MFANVIMLNKREAGNFGVWMIQDQYSTVCDSMEWETKALIFECRMCEVADSVAEGVTTVDYERDRWELYPRN